MAIIVASGTFVLKGRWLFATGTFVYDATPTASFKYQSLVGTPTSGTLQGGFPGNGVLSGTGGTWSPATLDTVPSGFSPTTGLNATISILNSASPSTNGRVYDGLLCGETFGPENVTGFDVGIGVALPDNIGLVDVTGIVTLNCADVSGAELATLYEEHSINLQGNYVIILFWWTIPALSECGDIQESRMQLAGASPGPEWERLDPLDDDAAPVPTVDTVTPNHGPLAGGDSVTIDGSGFGDAATVTFDGVAATNVVTVSQFRITCDAPAHAAGAADVVVTNEDGVVSI